MPVRIEVSLGEEVHRLRDSNPHEPPACLTHHDPENPHLVIIFCDSEDIGGRVFRAAPGASVLSPDATTRLMTGEGELEAEIGNHATYERDLVTVHGLGRLVLTHY